MAVPVQNQADYADAIINSCQRLIFLATVQVTNPTQAGVDAIMELADGSGVMRPQPNSSVDGESYSWESYITALTGLIERWTLLRQTLQGPFMLVNYGR